MGTIELREIGKLAKQANESFPRLIDSSPSPDGRTFRIDHDLKVASDGRSLVEFSVVRLGAGATPMLEYLTQPLEDVQLKIENLISSIGCNAWRFSGSVDWSEADREFLTSRVLRIAVRGSKEEIELEVPRMSPSILFDRRTVVLQPSDGGDATVLSGQVGLTNLLERPVKIKLDTCGLPLVSTAPEFVIAERTGAELEFFLDVRSLVATERLAREISFEVFLDGETGTRRRLTLPVEIRCTSLGKRVLIDETPQVFGRVDASDQLSCRIGYLRTSDGQIDQAQPLLHQRLQGATTKKLDAPLQATVVGEEEVGEDTIKGELEVSIPAEIFLKSGSFGIEISLADGVGGRTGLPVRAYPGRLTCVDHGETGIMIEIPEDATKVEVAGIMTFMLENRLDAGRLDMRFGTRIGSDFCTLRHTVSSDRLASEGNSILRRLECDFAIELTLPSRSFEIQLPAEVRVRWQPGTIESYLPVRYRTIECLLVVVFAQYTAAKKSAEIGGKTVVGRFRTTLRRANRSVSTFKVASARHSSCDVLVSTTSYSFGREDKVTVDLVLLEGSDSRLEPRARGSRDVRLQELTLNLEILQVTAEGLRIASNSFCVVELV